MKQEHRNHIMKIARGIASSLGTRNFEWASINHTTKETVLVFALDPKGVVFNEEIVSDVYTEILTVKIRIENNFSDLSGGEELSDYVEAVLNGCEAEGFFAISKFDSDHGVIAVGDVISDAEFFIGVDHRVSYGGRISLR